MKFKYIVLKIMAQIHKPSWGIGTEVEIGVIEAEEHLIYDKTTNIFKIISIKNNIIKEDKSLENLLMNDKYLISKKPLTKEDMGYGKNGEYLKIIETTLKTGIRMIIFKLTNPLALLESQRLISSGKLAAYGINSTFMTYNFDPDGLNVLIIGELHKKTKELRDFEQIKTAAGKKTPVSIVELATEDWKDRTIDAHIADIKRFLQKFSQDNDGCRLYNGELYHFIYEHTYQENVNGGMLSPIGYFGRLGAIHLNITMPVATQDEEHTLSSLNISRNTCIEKDNDEKIVINTYFYKHHELLAFLVQFIQPVLIGFYGVPDNRAVLDGGMFTKSSSRSFTNRLSNSPLIGLTQFPDGKKLYNVSREGSFSSLDNHKYTNAYLDMIKDLFGYSSENIYTIEDSGSDINRRIDIIKGRNQFFGFEIRNIDFSGYTDLNYYKAYIQLIFLLSYYILNNEQLVKDGRKDFSDNYTPLINSMREVLLHGFNGNLDNAYIYQLNMIFKTTSNETTPLVYFTYLYSHLFSFFEKTDHSLKQTYSQIIGNKIYLECPNMKSLFKIVKYLICSLSDDKQMQAFNIVKQLEIDIKNYGDVFSAN